MFQFTGFASLAGYYTFSIAGCPIRTPADHIVCADPRGFSQLVASFVASGSPGIPHTPLSGLSPDMGHRSSRPCPFAMVAGGRPPAPFHLFTLYSLITRPPVAATRFVFRFPSPYIAVRRPNMSMIFRSATVALSGNGRGMWRMSESNRRPPACKAGALAS